MDMREASAMTEASGLVNDERGGRGSSRPGMAPRGTRRPAERLSGSQEIVHLVYHDSWSIRSRPKLGRSK